MTDQIVKSFLNLKPSDDRVFIFDIDSTLYDVTPRNQQIVRHFGQTKELDFDLKIMLQNFDSKSEDWGIKPGLMRLKLNSLSHDLVKAIKNHWDTHFFSKDFLHLDQEYPGAVHFLQKLDELSSVYYLTGRDQERMGEGTYEQLKASRFPMDPQRNKLILKPDKGLLDHTYKLEELMKLQDKFQEIHFFENEPVILNAVYDQAPQIKLYYIDSVNSGRAEIYPHIQKIKPIYTLGE
jgi:hypothetical protein